MTGPWPCDRTHEDKPLRTRESEHQRVNDPSLSNDRSAPILRWTTGSNEVMRRQKSDVRTLPTSSPLSSAYHQSRSSS